jgi:formyl-CoA transferase/CoA:oxalate CoA-transferase
MANVSAVGVLDGLRVLDLGLLVQGPQAALMLGDMGADVIKVELPGFGDQARWITVSRDDRRAPYFLALNRGKRSVTLDLRTQAGAEAFRRLAATADVVISNFKPGTLDGWGLSYEQLSADNPRLVYATGSAFGPVGPDAEREGADLAGQASGGLISATGTDGGDPTPVGVTLADHIASQNLVAGILAALLHREHTGRGQRVDSSLLGGQIYAQASEYTFTFLTGEQPGRANRGHPLIRAVYGIFPTSDGWLAIIGVPAQLRDKFFEAIERPDLAEEPCLDHPLLSPEEKVQAFGLLSDVFRARTTTEWVERLRAHGQRVAPVRTYAEAAVDPQVLENGYIVPADDPTSPTSLVIGSPIRMSDTPLVHRSSIPELGQHTAEVLEELGYSWEEIAGLLAAGG